MLRDENGMLNGYVYVDVAGRDVGGYVEEAKQRGARASCKLPPGYSLAWSGQYEAMERVREKLTVVLPLTLFLILMLLYMNTKSVAKTLIIVLAVPFSAVGAIWLLYLLGYNMSIGVWVGLIALLGVDAETGVFMLLYLDLAYEKAEGEGRLRSLADLQQAILHGAVKRIRPKFMTVATHVRRAGSDHVVHGRGRRRDEAHRRADDRRHLHVVPAGAGGLSGDLRGVEMAFRSEKAIGCLMLAARTLTAAEFPPSTFTRGATGRRADGGRKRRIVSKKRSRRSPINSAGWNDHAARGAVAPTRIEITTYKTSNGSWDATASLRFRGPDFARAYAVLQASLRGVWLRDVLAQPRQRCRNSREVAWWATWRPRRHAASRRDQIVFQSSESPTGRTPGSRRSR